MKRKLGKKAYCSVINMQIMRGCPCKTICDTSSQWNIGAAMVGWTSGGQ